MNLEALIQLSNVEEIGNVTLIRLVNHFGSPEEVLKAPTRALESVDGISPRKAAAIRRGVDAEIVKRQVDAVARYQIRVITLWDDDYPPRLRQVEYDPPALLYVRGKSELLGTDALSIVGTRSFTAYGEAVVREIVEGLAGTGLTIVSGLASGIDGLAHAAALACGLPTLAVFGCGVERIYPPSNAELGRRLLENGGAFVSEFPFGTEPFRGHFPRRNRIIAGLSLGTLVVEAGEKSGALITALLAVNLGREVMAVPGSVHNPKSRGCHTLIRDGAALVENAQQVLQVLKVGSHTPKSEQTHLLEPDMAEDEKRIWQQLNPADGVHVDRIAESAHISVAEALGTLLMMELKGMVRQLPGKYFVRA